MICQQTCRKGRFGLKNIGVVRLNSALSAASLYVRDFFFIIILQKSSPSKSKNHSVLSEIVGEFQYISFLCSLLPNKAGLIEAMSAC